MNIVGYLRDHDESLALDYIKESKTKEDAISELNDYASEAIREHLIRVIKKCIFANKKCTTAILDGAKGVETSYEFEKYIEDVCFYVGLDNPIFYDGSEMDEAGITRHDKAYSAALDIRQYLYGAD